MKHALALLLLSCVLVAQDKPAAEAPKPAAEAPNPTSAAATAEYLGRIPPINVRDELIELVHLLKADATGLVYPPKATLLAEFAHDPMLQESLKAGFDARMKAKTEAQRLLLQALLELAKLPAESPTAYHSLSPPGARNPRRIPPTPSK
jgi:hypothetical protein